MLDLLVMYIYLCEIYDVFNGTRVGQASTVGAT